eukprot:178985-Prorocentrum_minimum.AAC.1
MAATALANAVRSTGAPDPTASGRRSSSASASATSARASAARAAGFPAKQGTNPAAAYAHATGIFSSSFSLLPFRPDGKEIVPDPGLASAAAMTWRTRFAAGGEARR